MIEFKEVSLSRFDRNFVLFFPMILKILSSPALLCGMVKRNNAIFANFGSDFFYLTPYNIHPIIRAPFRDFHQIFLPYLLWNIIVGHRFILLVPLQDHQVGGDPWYSYQNAAGRMSKVQLTHQKKLWTDLKTRWTCCICRADHPKATISHNRCTLFHRIP